MAHDETTPKKSARPKPRAPSPRRSTSDKLGHAAVAAFEEEALGLAEADVHPCRVNVALARHNALLAHQAVLGARARIAKLPGTELGRLLEIPKLALALDYAASQVVVPAGKNLGAGQARAAFLRRLLLLQAEVLVMKGLLPAAKVKKIQEGQGALDVASDCVALASLFEKEKGKLGGKHAIEAREIREAAELGAELLERIAPASAKRTSRAKVGIGLRDRLFTLLVQRHAEARRALGYLFGLDRLDALAPSLGSARRRPPKKKAPAPPAEPKG